MNQTLKKIISIDWLLVLPVIALFGFGLITNYPIGEPFVSDSLFFKQLIHVVLAIGVIFIGSLFPVRILRSRTALGVLYLLSFLALVGLLLFAPTINGAQSWFNFGMFAIQPVDFVKIVLILVLAQYFSERHSRLSHTRSLLGSLFLMLGFFSLVILQPDLGSSVVLGMIWIGMLLVSGIPKKHLIVLTSLMIIVASIGFQFLQGYQQERIISFLTPYADIQATGYTAHQAKIAIGSGELFGKGVFEGTQSRLQFLPLHESDFVFASFAEEWGFIGVIIVLLLFIAFGVRLLYHALYGKTRFESFLCIGVFIMIFSHTLLHVGVNVGVFPVTGITLSFMSYGGSHILAEAIATALVLSTVRYQAWVR